MDPNGRFIVKSVVTQNTKEIGYFEWEIEDVLVHSVQYRHHSQYPRLTSIPFFTNKSTSTEETWTLSLYGSTDDNDPQCKEFMNLDLLMLKYGHGPSDQIYFEVKFGGTLLNPYVTNRGCLLGGNMYDSSLDLLRIPQSVCAQDFVKLMPDGKLVISLKLMSFLEDAVTTNFYQLQDDYDLQDETMVMADSFSKLLKDQTLSDVTIVCGSEQFPAHKAILAARSPVFSRMFACEMKESLEKVVRVRDIDPHIMKLALQFIYHGKVLTIIEPDDLTEVLGCAEKYDLSGLKSLCLRKMFGSITEQNVGGMAVTAHLYNVDPALRKKVIDFCTRRHAVLIKDPEYKQLFLAHPAAFLGD